MSAALAMLAWKYRAALNARDLRELNKMFRAIYNPVIPEQWWPRRVPWLERACREGRRAVRDKPGTEPSGAR